MIRRLALPPTLALFCAGVVLILPAARAATPLVEWSASGYAVAENAGTLAVRVTRTGLLSDTSIVTFASSNGTAAGGVDFMGVAGTLTFLPGETNHIVNIPLLDNASPQAARTFSLLLANFTNAVPGLPSNATVTILDDETSAVLDPWFNPSAGADNDVFTLGLLADGRILVGGQFGKWNNVTGLRNFVVLRPDGALDPAFATPANVPDAPVYAGARAADGGILLGGDFTAVGGVARSYLARVRPGGGVDTNFVPAAMDNSLRALIVQPDGKILIAGRFTQVGGQPRGRVARLLADGSLDATFAPASGANNSIRSLALQPDGRVLIGGQFTAFDGVARGYVARLLTNGTLDASFDPGTGADKQVRSVAVQADGKVLLGGDFENINGAVRSCVARLLTNGAVDADFDSGPSTNDFVRAVAPAAGGRVWVGGSFDFRGGAIRYNLALLGTNGLAEPFTADTGGEVNVFLVQPGGPALVAGDFTSTLGFSTPRLARLNTDGVSAPAPRIQLPSGDVIVPETFGQAPLRVSRRGDLAAEAGADFTSTNGTALAGTDYTATAGRLTFAPWETEKVLGVPLLNDSLPEPGETFAWQLTHAVPPATLGPAVATTITIQDDDTGFEFTADTFAASEPAGAATISVRRGGTGDDTVTVEFVVTSGTAVAGSDFLATNGNLIFQPGETQKTFSVSIVADGLSEGLETAVLTLTNAGAGAALGLRRSATLTMEDVDGIFQWGYVSGAGEPGDAEFLAVVERRGVKSLPASVDFATADGTALAGWDYLATQGTLAFAPGQASRYFSVVILNDGLVEGNEAFTLRLNNPTVGTVLGADSNRVVAIVDNDAGMAFTETNLFVSENSPAVTLTALRHDDGTAPLSVDYATADGTALAGVNYLARQGTLNFPASNTTNTITIPILDMCELTNGRTFTVTLASPSAGGALGSNRVAWVTVVGNDGPGRRDHSWLTSSGVGRHEVAALSSGQTLALSPGTKNNAARSYLLRLDRDGSIETNFSPVLTGSVSDFGTLALLRDGKILISYFTLVPEANGEVFERRLPSGAKDLAFHPPSDMASVFQPFNNFGRPLDVTCSFEQPDGKIVVGRDNYKFCCPTPPRHAGVIRLRADGAADATFQPGLGAQYSSERAGVRAVAGQPDGRILVGGLFTNFSGFARPGLVRLETNGQVEAGFIPAGGSPQLNVSEIKLQTDGKILLVGAFTNLSGTALPGLARLFTNGLTDTSFHPMPITGGAVRRILLQPNGRIVIGGNFTNVQGFARSGLARLNHDGTLDQSFDPAPHEYDVTALALQPDGRILVSDASTGLWRVAGDPVPRVRPLVWANGGATLRLDSRPGKTYALEGSTNLVNWRRLQTNTATDCALEFLDLASPPPHRFYRAVQLAP